MRRRGLVLGGVVLLALPGTLAGCVEPPPVEPAATSARPGTSPSGGVPTPPASPSAPPSTGASPPAAGTPAPTLPVAPVVSNLAGLRSGIAELEGQLGAKLGVAVAVAGATGIPGPDDAVGQLTTGAAWSTAKVPLALAALAAHPGRTTETLVARAIRQSDNEAAQQLWDAWPTPEAAAAAVAAVLRAGGDPLTTVPTAPLRTGFSVVGQTDWPLARQARFAADLACLPHATTVLDHMRQVADNQRWGVSTSDGFTTVARKGGWGPGVGDSYLVRQLASVTVAGRTFGIALAVEARPATLGAGITAIDALSRWLGSRLRTVVDGRCAR